MSGKGSEAAEENSDGVRQMRFPEKAYLHFSHKTPNFSRYASKR